MTNADLVPSGEVLRLLKLKSRTSLSLLVLSGKLTPAIETPNGRLFNRADVEALAAERAS